MDNKKHSDIETEIEHYSVGHRYIKKPKDNYSYICDESGSDWCDQMGVTTLLFCSVTWFPFLLLMGSISAFVFFYDLSLQTGDPLWFSRSGGLVAVFSIMLEIYIIARIRRYSSYYKYIRATIHGKYYRESLDPYVETLNQAIYYLENERRLGHKVVIALAILSTIIWAYGDLLVISHQIS